MKGRVEFILGFVILFVMWMSDGHAQTGQTEGEAHGERSVSDEEEASLLGIGFYNVENLFDTINDPHTLDDDFTPLGANRYSPAVYQEKQKRISRVISELGQPELPHGLSVLGLAEVENKTVLRDLVNSPALRKRNYQFVHEDSPYNRGMDVAFVYNPRDFLLKGSRVYPLAFVERGDTSHSRDILHVYGDLDGEPIHFLINHWPSRSGGEQRSAHKRKEGADICRMIYDSLRRMEPDVRVIVMGDLNDDPVSPSVRDHLRSVGDQKKLGHNEFFNPFWKAFKRGIGSNAWRDTWSLFDQIILSASLTDRYSDSEKLCFQSARIYNAPYLCQSDGRFAGYPFRTYAGSQYMGGYSDHFPVFVFLKKSLR